jgi:hypothetical protein
MSKLSFITRPLFLLPGRIRTMLSRPLPDLYSFLFVTIIPAVAAYVAIADYFRDAYIYFVKVEVLNGTASKVSINGLFIYTLTFLIFSLMAVTIRFAIRLYNRSIRAKKILASLKEKRRYNNRLRKAYDKFGKEIGKVYNQLFYGADVIKHDFQKIHTTYNVSENGDVSVVKQIEIRAVEEPVHFWQSYIDGYPHAPSQLLFTDIGFSVSSEGDHQCAFAPVRDGLQRKEFVIFFLPYIKPGELRSLQITYKWPGLLRGLLVNKEDDFYWENKGFSKDKLTDFMAKFIFSSKFPNLHAEITGSKPEGSTIHFNRGPNEIVVDLKIPKMPISNSGAKYQITFSTKGNGG